jgi:hypothetical protein
MLMPRLKLIQAHDNHISHMNLSFQNKVALVTGAGSGMGLVTARTFAEAGAAVALADVNENAVRSAAEEFVAAGHKAIALRCNVADETAVAAMVEQTVSTFGRLDAAFNNAGIQSPAVETADASGEEFDRVNGINLRGVWNCMKYELRQMESTMLRENFTESFISALRYARHSQGMKVIHFRNFLFSLVISIVPALLPVIALKEMHLSASQLGLVFTCVGVGSLGGAVFALPYLRERISPNAITSISMAIMVVVLVAMSFTRQVPALMVCATLAGVVWALAGSELWVAGQRLMPAWVRGRMNSFQIMLGQGGIAIGALIWGSGVANAGPSLTFTAAALFALAVLAFGLRFSINFASEARVEAAPIDTLHDFPAPPQDDDGPITVTVEYSIANENRQRFRIVMQDVQAAFRRNGAFHCRLDECLERPGIFRLEFIVSTWAEHLRQGMRLTVDESKVIDAAWDLHTGGSEPVIRHYLASQRFVRLHGYGFFGRTFGDTSNWSRSRLAPTAA